ncbi:threonine synthase [Solicola gregarius]|uniref:Pyridoxal-phosphate dependent enzyme n=1 Tax=Solicola gregarius TaxID=2908642 RepID=A0AA46TIU8_9ACTN|nr:pyridoxal-phosphate dependent enzyme [Solicola gregarius]UYM05657.1 pyridoxal-phosphate dependent enzyme [Solicola gregarius]
MTSLRTAAHAGITPSLATGQRCVHDPRLTYALWPPLTAGCPGCSNEQIAYPLEVTYDYAAIDAGMREALFDRTAIPLDVRGWGPLLPPFDARLGPGVGSTPLIDGLEGLGEGVQVLVKDESRNPTWSHKDRLNLMTISAAAASGAPGVVVASSGNHGASAAAMSARLDLPCVVVMSSDGPPLMAHFAGAYGATVLSVRRDARWQVVRDIVDKLGFHPVSNRTVTHTGHPFGPEGYKTIAYELFIQLGHRLPSAVFIPTGYGELLYGVWKGFEELRILDLVDSVPALYACEVAGRGVLKAAIEQDQPAVTIDEASTTDAFSIATTTGGYRATHVMHRTAGSVLGVTDTEMAMSQRTLAAKGIWQELSGVAGVAGLQQTLRRGATFDGPVVCLATSSGLKDVRTGVHQPIETGPDWSSISGELRRRGIPGT